MSFRKHKINYIEKYGSGNGDYFSRFDTVNAEDSISGISHITFRINIDEMIFHSRANLHPGMSEDIKNQCIGPRQQIVVRQANVQ